MPSADRRPGDGGSRGRVAATRTTAALATTATLALGVGAAGAHADVVRVTAIEQDSAPRIRTVAGFSAAAAPGIQAGPGAPLTGLEGPVEALATSPTGTATAFLSAALYEDEGGPAGLVPLAGGAVRRFSDAAGRAVRSGPARHARADGWLSWSTDGTTVTLHGTERPWYGPWIGAPSARDCDPGTARCGPPRAEDAVALPGGGTVRIRAALSASGVGRTTILASDEIEARATRRLAERRDRRYAVRVRVTGRPGASVSRTLRGRPRSGAPAYDRAFPSAAGVLVRTATAHAPRPAKPGADVREGLEVDTGESLAVGADGRIRSVGALPYDVVGTLPDGRWLLAGGADGASEAETGERQRAPAGEPLRTLDTTGRIAVLSAGGRAVTPIWAASTAGLPDSVATSSRVVSAGVDRTSGQLVLVLANAEEDAVVAVALDGAAPPHAIPGPTVPRGAGAFSAWFVR